AGARLFIPTSGGFNDATARVDQLLVLDTTDPAAPVQRDSLTVATHTSHSSAALTGDGRHLFVLGSIAARVSQVDVDSEAVVATVEVHPDARVIATFGTAEGPSHVDGPGH